MNRAHSRLWECLKYNHFFLVQTSYSRP